MKILNSVRFPEDIKAVGCQEWHMTFRNDFLELVLLQWTSKLQEIRFSNIYLVRERFRLTPVAIPTTPIACKNDVSTPNVYTKSLSPRLINNLTKIHQIRCSLESVGINKPDAWSTLRSRSETKSHAQQMIAGSGNSCLHLLSHTTKTRSESFRI